MSVHVRYITKIIKMQFENIPTNHDDDMKSR